MEILTLDFETFWSQTHTLSKMSPIEYVMHPETEIISCSIKVGDYNTDVFFGEANVRKALNSIKGRIEAGLLIAHNMSGFDAMICAWRFGIKPKMWGCTLAMARPIHSLTVGNSLAKLVEHYQLGVKNNAALINTRGKHLVDFTEAEIADMRTYNRDDTDQCRALFDRLRPHTNATELWRIDSTIRMLVEPQFVLDTALLNSALARERTKKRKSLMTLAEQLDIEVSEDEDVTAERVRTELMSSAKFSAILTAQGVEVPMKPSPSNPESGKKVPALAKSDQAFLDLQESDNELVAAAAMARLEAKSTLLETRIEAFLTAGSYCGGYLPVPIRYYGAHTGRDSGEQYNPQNLPRISRDKDGKVVPKLTNALRLSLRVPKGYKVVVADLSGIELRINHFLWQVISSMKLFQASPDKADLYKDFASKMYYVPLEEVTKAQRQVGKVAHLGLGFQAGAATFKLVAKSMGGVTLTDNEALGVVQSWRGTYPDIVDGWETCQNALRFVESGKPYQLDMWGLLHTCKDGIRLPGPGNRIIRYPDLRQRTVTEGPREGQTEWVYGQGRNLRKIYGGRVCENVVQGIGAEILMDYVLTTYKQTGYRPALRVHDEPVYVIPEAKAEGFLDKLQTVMRTPPAWWPELITWSEGDIADSYGLAK